MEEIVIPTSVHSLPHTEIGVSKGFIGLQKQHTSIEPYYGQNHTHTACTYIHILYPHLRDVYEFPLGVLGLPDIKSHPYTFLLWLIVYF